MVTNSSSEIHTGASGTVLQGQGIGTASAFSTATYPATTTSQQILYSSATNVIGQLTTANSKFPATNSSGTLAMRALSVVNQVFTTTTTYTPTTGMVYCIVQCLGGGGAGGGAPGATLGNFSMGGGGSAGEYAVGTFSAATIGASQTATIGSAGTGNSGSSGGNGGTTSLGSLITAVGGTGGVGGTNSVAHTNSGVAGGTGGTGGDYRTPGFSSDPSMWYANGVSVGFTGAGANSQLGSGGIGFYPNGTVNGHAASGYGAGGSGSGDTSTGGSTTGGNGSPGIVIITEYVIA